MNPTDMINGLWITLIGMGLVFVAILLLWGLMEVIVRLTAERETKSTEAAMEAEVQTAPAVETGSARKRQAAVAAVAIALALRGASQAVVSRPEGNALSSWQAAFRALRQSQHGNLYRNKR